MQHLRLSKSALASTALAVSVLGLSACTSYDHIHPYSGGFTGPAVKGSKVQSAGTAYHTSGGQGSVYSSGTTYSGSAPRTYSSGTTYSGSTGTAYGSQPTYQTAHYGAPKLRGPHVSKRDSYKYYGTLGAVTYEGDVFGVQGRVGTKFTRNFGAEAEASTGVTRKNGAGIDYQVAAFGVGRLPVGERINVLARAGYHFTESSAGAISSSDNGITYGIGAEYDLNSASAVRGGWTRYDASGGASDAFSVSYLRRF